MTRTAWICLMTWLAAGLGASGLAAQTCFWYSDNIDAATPIQCVQKNDPTQSCEWDPPLLPAGQDCASIEGPNPQTVLEMHEEWHECFGGVGGDNPPPGRGQRWYAFHRQFEYDFNLWRDANGFDLIEQLDWCPGMNLPVAHDGAGLPASGPGSHPSGCGTGPGRPADVPCDTCIAFPQCLFHAGAGPMACPDEPSSSCSTGVLGGLSFPHTALEQFDNVDDVAQLLDATFHGHMHGAIWVADLAPECTGSTLDDDCIYNGDTLTSNCSPRDPMFWRLHKALDDVVRAWQDHKAVDVVVVIDRSGSMGDPDPSGVSKLEAAVRATEYFADMLDHQGADGQVNRIGLVTYSGAAAPKLPLTDAVPGLLGGDFGNAVTQIRSEGTGGCTSLGAGIEEALAMLCPNGGDCTLNPQPAPAGTNARKAILLLTDGLENVSPCLESAGAAGDSCGSQCFGASLDYDDLELTQFVAVGFGNPGALNGELLTLLAERQGGIYVHNPGAPGDDLKYFFTMAFGQLTDEFVFTDPKGTLAANDLATPVVEHTVCGADGKITYTSGWQDRVSPGELRLLVENPDGSLVTAADALQASTEDLWAFERIATPDRGTWRGNLIRPHLQFYNGFAPDAFARPEDGVTIVRREIHRLCPEGCKRVLLFESGVDPDRSAYRAAVEKELATGLLGAVERVDDPVGFARRLDDPWDLIVYAATKGGPQRYDARLTDRLCRGQRALVTDLRESAGGDVLECAQAGLSEELGWSAVEGDGRLFDGAVKLVPTAGNPPRGFVLNPGIQATANRGRTGAIHARGALGHKPQRWFINVLGQGLGKLSPVPMSFHWQTGDMLRVSARILAPYHLAGGWDHVDARVEVTYPLESIGTILAEKGLREVDSGEGRENDPRSQALAGLVVPTKTAVFRLYDDGTHGDINPRNGQWTTTLTGLGDVDGTYKLRYIFDLTSGGCTTRREVTQDLVVDLQVDPESSRPKITQDGGTVVVQVQPRDSFGNLWGPGRMPTVRCEPAKLCRVRKVDDAGQGVYSMTLAVRDSVPGVRLDAFGADFDLGLDCDRCPQLVHLELPRRIEEHQRIDGKLVLDSEAASATELTVFLESSNPRLARVPETVLVRPGAATAGFPVEILHAHHGPEQVEITARLGDRAATGSIFVQPVEKENVEPFRLPEGGMMMHMPKNGEPEPR